MTLTRFRILFVSLLISVGYALAGSLPACSDRVIPEIEHKQPLQGGYNITRYSKIDQGTSWQVVYNKYIGEERRLEITYSCETQPADSSETATSIVYLLRYSDDHVYLILEIAPGGWVERLWARPY